MIVSNEKKFIFCSVPKTASTAMESVLCEYENFIPDVKNKKHAPFWELRNQLDLSDYFTFCFFRNPWDLMVSKYFFHVQKGIIVHDNEFYFTDDNINKLYFNDVFYNFEEYIFNETTSRLTYEYVNLYTQTDYIRGVNIDKVYQYENIENATRDIEQTLDITINLPVKNKSSHKPYQYYYTDTTKAVIAERWQDSIDRMGYTFCTP